MNIKQSTIFFYWFVKPENLFSWFRWLDISYQICGCWEKPGHADEPWNQVKQLSESGYSLVPLVFRLISSQLINLQYCTMCSTLRNVCVYTNDMENTSSLTNWYFPQNLILKIFRKAQALRLNFNMEIVRVSLTNDSYMNSIEIYLSITFFPQLCNVRSSGSSHSRHVQRMESWVLDGKPRYFP